MEVAVALNIVEKIDGSVKIKHVLASVSDKSGLDALIPGLVKANPDVKIYSTGGTYAAIEKILGDKSAKNLVAVSEYTGQPEMQGGLVKTLDFKIYLGLLSETYNPAHQDDLERVGGVAIDMVIVNLYPFKSTVAAEGVTPEMARTNIDIGGPCMVRASAKNYLRVASVTDPADYAGILEELESCDSMISLDTRLNLMKKAFAHTAEYDKAISEYFAKQSIADAAGCYEVAV
jgi:phosphoribosylaminoimidazolecarboxamide formyltransferase/IMP cyclohydrolase